MIEDSNCKQRNGSIFEYYMNIDFYLTICFYYEVSMNVNFSILSDWKSTKEIVFLNYTEQCNLVCYK